MTGLGRPDLYAIYPTWFTFTDPKLGFLTPIMRFRLARMTVTGGPEKGVYKPDYSLFNSGDEPGEIAGDLAAYRVVDRVDVADLASERDHGYSLKQREVGVERKQVLLNRVYAQTPRHVVDGGRIVSGGEEFTLKLRDPQKPYVVLMRTASPASATIDVAAAGQSAAVQVPATDDTKWRDVVIARGQGGGRDDVRISVADRVGSTGYTSFYYWLLQPE